MQTSSLSREKYTLETWIENLAIKFIFQDQHFIIFFSKVSKKTQVLWGKTYHTATWLNNLVSCDSEELFHPKQQESTTDWVSSNSKSSFSMHIKFWPRLTWIHKDIHKEFTCKFQQGLSMQVYLRFGQFVIV